MFGNDCVNLGGCYPRRNNLSHKLVGLPNADTRLPHERDFTFRFELDHGIKPPNDNCLTVG